MKEYVPDMIERFPEGVGFQDHPDSGNVAQTVSVKDEFMLQAMLDNGYTEKEYFVKLEECETKYLLSSLGK